MRPSNAQKKEASLQDNNALDIYDSAKRVLNMEADALRKLAESLGPSFEQAVLAIEKSVGHVIVSGIGKSGHVARKIAATFSSTGTPSLFVHPAEASHGDMGMITQDDVVIALSNSGESRELSDIIAYTRRFAIPLIAITRNPLSTLGEKADICLLLPQIPEACPLDLAPTTSTTLSMALGDALAVALLERKGFTKDDFQIYHPGGKLGQQLLHVKDIMHTGKSLPLIAPGDPAKDAIDCITEKGFGCVFVINNEEELLGIITDGDVRRHVMEDMHSRTVADIMTPNPKHIMPDTLVATAVGNMNNVKGDFRNITVLPVVDEQKRVKGILHIHDCLRAGFG